MWSRTTLTAAIGLAMAAGAAPLAAQQTCNASNAGPPPNAGCSAKATASLTIPYVLSLDIGSTALQLDQPSVADFTATKHNESQKTTATVSANSNWQLSVSTSTATFSNLKAASDLSAAIDNGNLTPLGTTAGPAVTGNAVASAPHMVTYQTAYDWTKDAPTAAAATITVQFTLVAQ